MLNKPITHPTIKSFVYLDIDSRRDKGRSSSFDKSGHSRRHIARLLARSLVRYARLRLLVRAGPSAEKGVPMLPMNAVCAVSKRKLILGEKGEGGRKKERKKGRRTIKERGRRERERWKEGTTMHKVSQDARGNVATGGGGGTKTYNGHNGGWILSLSLPTVWALGWVRRRYSSRRTFEKITSSGLSAPFSSSFSLSKVAFSIVGIRRTDPFFTRCAWL